MSKLLCWFGFHKDEYMREVIFKSEYQETSNGWDKCKRCGRTTEKTGFTHIGPIKVILKK
jgi:hypothetical protein